MNRRELLTGAALFAGVGQANAFGLGRLGEGVGSLGTLGGASSQPSLYLGQVATRSFIPDFFEATTNQIMSQSGHVLRDDITSLQVVYGGWHRNVVATENAMGADTTITASVSLSTSGPWVPFKWSGSTPGTIPNNLTVESDVLPFAASRGSIIYIRSWKSCSAGTAYNGFATCSAALGDGALKGTTTPDVTTGGAFSAGGAIHAPPLAVIAMTRRASICLVTDSRGFSYNDTADAAGELGEVCRSIGPSFAYINTGKKGLTPLGYLNSSPKAQALAVYCSHIFETLGINSGTFAQKQSIWALFPDKKIVANTISPSTSGAWTLADGSDQTSPSTIPSTINPLLLALPSPLVAVFDTAAAVTQVVGGLNKWLAPGYTADGVHGSQLACLAIKNGGAVNTALIHR